MSRAGLILGLFTLGMASTFAADASAQRYPLPEERTRQNLNEAMISADVIRALPDPSGVLTGKGDVSVREYDELIRLLMDAYVGDDAISVDEFLAPYPEKYRERFPQKLLIEELRRFRERAVPYACKQERFHHTYLMNFLPSNINSSETMLHDCNAQSVARHKAREQQSNSTSD